VPLHEKNSRNRHGLPSAGVAVYCGLLTDEILGLRRRLVSSSNGIRSPQSLSTSLAVSRIRLRRYVQS
jgi:hypothetical protein